MRPAIANFYHQYDLPNDVVFAAGALAVDTEAMGLHNARDRLCVVQISDGHGDAHLVHYPTPDYNSPNLCKLLQAPDRLKLFHFARFDVAIIYHYLGVLSDNLYCTKIVSKLCRTYTDQHSLKELCHELLGVKISKQCRTSDWGAAQLSPEQIDYAASDVLYLHQIKEKLDAMLVREKRADLADACFKFIPTRAKLDLVGWQEMDIFSHI